MQIAAALTAAASVTPLDTCGEDDLKMATPPIAIDDKGLTYIDHVAPKVRCATLWQDRAAFEAMLAERLTMPA